MKVDLKLDVKSLDPKSSESSSEDKTKKQNRIRQMAFKIRKKMPKDYNSFKLVLDHLVKNTPRYYKTDVEVKLAEDETGLKKEEICEDIVKKEIIESDVKPDIRCDDVKVKSADVSCMAINKKLREICSLKKQNRIKEQQQLVTNLKHEVGVFREISRLSGVSLKTVHDWCSLPKEHTHQAKAKAEIRKQEFTNFLMQDTITYSHPGKRYSGKRFMMFTWSELQKRYNQQPEFHQNGLISRTTMRSYKPKSVLLCGKTPVNQCLCDICENCNLIIRALLAVGLKGVPSNKYECLDSTFCEIHEGQFGTSYTFAAKKCITRTCQECGIDRIRNIIMTSNEQLLQVNKNITWHSWKVPEGKSAPMKTQVKGNLRAGINKFLSIVEDLSQHLFRANWHQNIFQYIRTHLMQGYVVQVQDFAMNFSKRYQDEVQSAYWNGTQTTIHATINFYKCLQDGCNDVVTLALVHISADRQHDSFLARAAMNLTFAYLVEVGVPLDVVLQFCDNCSSQYKSRHPFVEISHCALNLIRTYFREKHGKSHADALFGRLKAWMTYKIKARHFVVRSAHDFYKFCREFYQTPVLQGCCQHYRVHFEFICPCDVRRHQDSDLDKAVENTHKIYSVRNTPEPLQLKVRSVPCLCPQCIHENGPCQNAAHADPWKLVTLKPTKGANKNKYKKRPRPDARINKEQAVQLPEVTEPPQELQAERPESPSHCSDSADSDATYSYDGLEGSDEEKEDEEITFEIHDDQENEKIPEEQRKTQVVQNVDSTMFRNENVTDRNAVTDNVTDKMEKKEKTKYSWVNVSEEITEEDFISSDSVEDDNEEDMEIIDVCDSGENDVEIIDICQGRSQEFELSSQQPVKSKMDFSSVTDLFKKNLPEGTIWARVLKGLHKCKDYNTLEQLCHELKGKMPRLKERVESVFSPEFDLVDVVAQAEIPADGPRDFVKAVFTTGDGNCQTRALSRAFFNTDTRHLEIRARIVVEGVLNKKYYLDDNSLQRGATYIHNNADLPTVFTTFSDYYTPGQKLTDDSIDCIYSMEIHSIAKEATYMGLWQLAQSASVLGVPVHTIYPVRGQCTIRNDFNRTFFPVTYTHGQDENPVVMWTGLQKGAVLIHFVPLLPCNSPDQ